MKILIAEDDKAFANVLKQKFEHEHFEVEVVRDGADVYPFLKKGSYDLLLLDLLMPTKSGVEILKEIKNDTSLVLLPVIVCSNIADPAAIKEVEDLGARRYILKVENTLANIVEEVSQLLRG